MPTRTISTLQNNQVLDNTHGLVLSSGGKAVKIFNIEGYVNGGTTSTKYYLQLFARTDFPSNGDVPLRSLQVLGANGFTFAYQPTGLDAITLGTGSGNDLTFPNSGDLIIVASSTEATFTAVAANVDVSVDIEQYEQEQRGLLQVADTAVNELSIWSDSAANCKNRLHSGVFVNTEAIARYIMLFAYASPATGATPICQWTLPASGTVNLNFGDNESVFSVTSDGVKHYGCYFEISSTSGTFTSDGAVDVTINYYSQQ